MASPAQPDPTQGGGAPEGASPAASPSQAPANETSVRLSQLYQACKMLAAQNPVLSAGLTKAAQGIQEAASALVSQPQQQPTGATPPQ